MLTPEELIHLLNRLEEEMPVTQWRVRGVSLWPFMRTRTIGEVYKMTDLSLVDEVSKPPTPEGKAELSRARFDLSAPPQSADCLFLTNSINVKNVGNTQVDIYADPVRKALEASGLTCLTLEMEGIQGYSPHRRPGRYFVSGIVDEYLATCTKAPAQAADFGLPEWEAVHAELAAAELSVTAGLLFRTCDLWYFEALAAFFTKVFSMLSPKVVFITCYYAYKQMAAVHAARRLGIPVIDIQHGVQGKVHPAYGQWLNVPDGGYSQLPDLFAVWSDLERDTINDWRVRSGLDTHRPFVTGFPWIEKGTYSCDGSKADAAGPEKYGRKTILVSHQSSGYFPDWVYDALAEASSTHTILFRLHPRIAPIANQWEHKLQAMGLRDVDVKNATARSLDELLEKVDIHVTAFSSCVLEAREMGVPSVVVHPHGKAIFSDRFKDGSCLYAPDAEEFRKALEAVIPPTTEKVDKPPVAERYAEVLKPYLNRSRA